MENRFRKALKSGKLLLGTHVNLIDHRICEMLGLIGFDYLWIDMEHVSTDFKVMETNLIAAKATGTPCMVRVTWNDIPSIKRVIEAGPDAIVVPMTNSVEDVQRAIDTCIYPPEGKRGYGPNRAVQYGLSDMQDYINHGSKEMLRFVQIEDVHAVEVIEEMAKIPYLDGFIIGPMDLSASVGELGYGFMAPKTNALIDTAIKKAHEAGKPIGFSTGTDNPEELEHWIKKGVDFISASTDMWSVMKGARSLLSDLNKIAQKYPRI
ncbi:MAG: aldolase [Clostridia bacterium]|nr:aldolase [Clostridia bacterium]